MVEFRKGSLFDDGCDALVNTVNCVGVMGRGVALQFKNRFPDNFRAYAAACKAGEVRVGRMFVHDTGCLVAPRWIINFPTKRHWRGRSRIEDISVGLDDLARVVARLGIRSLSMPPVGCGLGGLSWRDVRPLVERSLAALDGCRFVVHEPDGAAEFSAVTTAASAMTPGRASLVELARRYLGAMMAPYLTLLEVHKLMYFLQEAGERLRLDFVKAPHGPYAENLTHVLRRIEGHFLYGYLDGGDNPDKPLSLVPGAPEEAESFLGGCPGTAARIRRVLGLCEGFESPEGMELLASVHWLATREGARDVDGVMRGFAAWGPSKGAFTARQAGIALGRIRETGFAAW